MGISAQQMTVVVAPFENWANMPTNDVRVIYERFVDELAKDKSLKVVDQSDAAFNQIISRMQFQLSDWSNNDKVAQLGLALNANAVVRVQLMRLEGESVIDISARILDVQTTQILASNSMEEVRSSREMISKLPEFTLAVIKNLPKPQAQVVTYKIGDKGPGGGIIFYVEGGQHMECSQDIGSYNWNGAVDAASNYRGGGFNDWRLPSIGELKLMYDNLFLKELGGFSMGYYWSSTQLDKNNSYILRFGYTSRTGNTGKTSFYSVRAVRSF